MSESPEKTVFVDTHVHLDDDQFTGDLDQVLTDSGDAGVTRCITIAIQPDTWQAAVEMAARFSQLFYSAGVHPHYADVWSDDVEDRLRLFLRLHHPVAIGESGLDYVRSHSERDAQMTAFDAQARIAEQSGLPLIVHMRGDVEADLRQVCDRYPRLHCVLHSFDGSAALRDYAIERRWNIGVGGLMTRRSNHDLRAVLQQAPLVNMLLETDAPYLAPRGWKHRRNSPVSIPLIAQSLAQLLGTSVDHVGATTTRKAIETFNLDSSEKDAP